VKDKLIKNRKKLSIIASVFVVVVSTLSYSYAKLTSMGDGKYYNTMMVGNLDVSYVDGGDGYGETLKLVSKTPISDEEGKKSAPYRFSVENSGKAPLMYTVKIKDDDAIIKADECSNRQLEKKYIKVQFDNEEPVLLSMKEENDYLFYTGALVVGDSDIHEVRVWLDKDSNTNLNNEHFHGKVVVESIQGESILANRAFTNMGASCHTYDDQTDTYLVGNCTRNYVSFADRLWRVVSKNNETNTVKLVADNKVESLSFNPTDKTSYKKGTIDNYLNSIFYDTIKEFDSFIVKNATWNIGVVAAANPTKELVEKAKLERSVGLLNAYEYDLINKKSSELAKSEINYLNNNSNWWLLTTKSGTFTYYVDTTGKLTTNTSTYQYDVRPVINIRANVKISYTDFGDGTIEQPYKLKIDK